MARSTDFSGRIYQGGRDAELDDRRRVPNYVLRKSGSDVD